ncbi:MAG: hypothetical protein IT529_01170 [Burkholderiales bacterium]|nr:hypothetical protein [Burkholderiales bacterium]
MRGSKALSCLPRGSAIAAALAIAASLAVLAGCTMLRLGYGQLDTFAVYRADEYFDLDPRQRQDFLARFERLHEWHRREQLPEYAAFLTEARARLERGVTRADVSWLMAGVEERFRTLARRGADDAAALLATVTPRQIEHLKARWEKDNRRFVREHKLDASRQERRSARVKRLVSRIENWTGDLEPEQQQRVAAAVAGTPSLERLRHHERLRRQREFLELLEQRDDRSAFAARLRHWLANWEEGRAPEEARQFQEARERSIDAYYAVARTLSPAQHAHLANRVQGYVGDFTVLAGR